MNFNSILKLFVLSFLFMIFYLPSFSEEDMINSLSQIVIDKPFDNSYQLNLYFNNNFQGNAFLQKRKNGSFYLFLPDTVMASKNIKVIYKNKVKKSELKLDIEEQPYSKESSNSKYLRLSVETPINSDIQLSSQTVSSYSLENKKFGSSIYTVIISVLLLVALLLIISIFKTIRTIKSSSKSYTTFPTEFFHKYQEDYSSFDYESSVKTDIDTKTISPISTTSFSCFDLQREKNDIPYIPLEEKNIQSKIVNPITQIVSSMDNNEKIEADNYRPELISELKISQNKGFYLTTVGDNSFALFGYIGEKIFFLRRFTNLSQVNLQARFYEHKDDADLYIIKLESYKAMLSVSDIDIKELAVV